VQLQDGSVLTVDENYVRESILTPAAKVTAGFQPVMPAFQGLISEEQLLALIEYVKSLSTGPQAQPVNQQSTLPMNQQQNEPVNRQR
jgi:cytochrome c oxidase subunit 2